MMMPQMLLDGYLSHLNFSGFTLSSCIKCYNFNVLYVLPATFSSLVLDFHIMTTFATSLVMYQYVASFVTIFTQVGCMV